MCIGLFAVASILAILINDFSLMFGLISPNSEACFDFLFPAAFFLLSARLKKIQLEKWQKAIAYGSIIIGVAFNISGNVMNVIKIIQLAQG